MSELDRLRAALVLIRRIHMRDTSQSPTRYLMDSDMVVEWVDDEIAEFIREYGPLDEQLRDLPTPQ